MVYNAEENKANAILRRAAEGKYGIAGVCVVSRKCHGHTKAFANIGSSTTWKAFWQQSALPKQNGLQQ